MNVAKYFFQMMGRASVFGNTHSELFAKGTPAGNGMAELVAAHQQYLLLTASVQGGDVSIKLSVDDKAQTHGYLRAVMETVSKLAKGLHLYEFFLPKDRAVDTLVSAGRMWTKSKDLRRKFTEAGYAEYLDKLNDAVAKMSRAIDAKTSRKSARVEAAVAIKQTYRDARETFRRLDAVVRLQLRDDPPVLAAWVHDCRIERPPLSRPPAGAAEQAVAQASPPLHVVRAAS